MPRSEWGRWVWGSLSPKSDDIWQPVLQNPAAVQDLARGGQLSHLLGSSSESLLVGL